MTQKSIEEIKKNINALQDKYKDITLTRINLTKKSIKETKEKLFNIKTKRYTRRTGDTYNVYNTYNVYFN